MMTETCMGMRPAARRCSHRRGPAPRRAPAAGASKERRRLIVKFTLGTLQDAPRWQRRGAWRARVRGARTACGLPLGCALRLDVQAATRAGATPSSHPLIHAPAAAQPPVALLAI